MKQLRWSNNALLVFLLMIVLNAGLAQAQWSRNTQENTRLGDRGYSSFGSQATIETSNGGFINVWLAYHSGYRLRGQHVDAQGNLLWNSEGLDLVTSGLTSSNTVFQVVSDYADGFYIIWEYSIGDSHQVRVMNILENGQVQWSAQACNYSSDQTAPQAVSDGNHGLFVGWIDDGLEIFAQHINHDGNLLWGSTASRVSSASIAKSQLTMAGSDDFNGAFFAWCDGSEATGYSLTAQKMDGPGSYHFDDTNLDDSVGTPNSLQIVANTLGGVYAVWAQTDSGVGVYHQLKGDSGQNFYIYDGSPLVGIYAIQDKPVLTVDEVGNTIIAYRDLSAQGTGRFVANYFRFDTWYESWGRYGKTLHEDDQFPLGEYDIIPDEAGGFYFAFEDIRQGGTHYSQRFNHLGESQWPMSRGAYSQTGLDYSSVMDLLAVHNGGVIATWICDSSNTDEDRPTMQKIDRNGFMADNGFTLLEVQDKPNDQGGELMVTWEASPLDNEVFRAIESYSLWVADLGLEKSGHTDSPMAMVPAKASDLAAMLKMEQGEVENLQKAGWVYTGQIPALFQNEYSTFCPSFGDSIGEEIQMTGVKVVAHHLEQGTFWAGLEMEGYSVDNLAPGAPVNLVGTPDAGAAVLIWSASGHHDEDLSEYLVYRSSEPGFVMDESTFAGSSLTPDFRDATVSGPVYYRVTARDVHGNEGAASDEVLVLLGVSAVDSLPTFFSHGGNYPNPFNPMTQISFDVPATSAVRVSVFDAAGHLVKTLVSETMNAGHHEVLWNGQDGQGHGVSSGVYFSRIEAGDFSATRSMTLVR